MEENTPKPNSSNHRMLGVIFLTVFLDLVGFGIIIPVLPLLAHHYGASGFLVGAIMSVYSLMQFLFSPMWGNWSDKIGRRPLMLFGTAGASVSYAVFALGAGMTGSVALTVFFLARMLAGFCGANLSVAQAAIADITPPEKRSRSMALIGIAFGLGFIFGPALGGLSLQWGGPAALGWTACALCAVNFLVASIWLPETRKLGADYVAMERTGRMKKMKEMFRNPVMGSLLTVFFLMTLGFTVFETTLGLLLGINLGLEWNDGRGKDAALIGYLFAYSGIIGVVAQGGVLRPLLKRMGEGVLLGFMLIVAAVSLVVLPWCGDMTAVLVALAFLSIGSTLTRPPLMGLVSRLSSDADQGASLGVAQSAGSLARVIGPLVAGTLFVLSPSWPYLLSGGLTLFAAILVFMKVVPHVKGMKTES